MGGWPFPVGVKVRADGTVTMFGTRHYWSEQSVGLRGLWVSAKEDHINHELIVEIGQREYVLGLIRDEAKRNPEAEAVERASIVRRQKEALLELIDQRINRAFVQNVVRPGLLAKLLSHGKNFFAKPWKSPLEDPEHGDLQATQGADIVADLLDCIFEHRLPLFGGHFQGASPDRVGFENPTAAAAAAHRLSETSK